MFRILLHFPERDNRWILKQAFLPGKAPLEGRASGGGALEGGLHADSANCLMGRAGGGGLSGDQAGYV
jgi:hypothetical protein